MTDPTNGTLFGFPKRSMSVQAAISLIGMLVAGVVAFVNIRDQTALNDERIKRIEAEYPIRAARTEADLYAFKELYVTKHHDLEDKVNDVVRRISSQADRLTSLDTAFSSLTTEIHASFRQQIETDKSILERIGQMQTSLAEVRVVVGRIDRLPVPPGTGTPRLLERP